MTSRSGLRLRADAVIASLLSVASQPHASASPTPPRRSEINSRNLRVMGTTANTSLRMQDSMSAEIPPAYVVATVQVVAPRPIRKCTTDAQREALTELRSVPEPLTIARAVRHLGWPLHDVRHWLKEFLARGYLVAEHGSRGCHRWTAEGRAA